LEGLLEDEVTSQGGGAAWTTYCAAQHLSANSEKPSLGKFTGTL